jgi:hypothetical protein
VSLEALSGVIQEFFGGVSALFRGAPYHSDAIFDRIGNRAGHSRSLVGGFCDVSRRSFHYGL